MESAGIISGARSVWNRNRRTFCAAFVTGILAYGFLMFNVLNNWDSIHEAFGGYGTGIELGRWLLTMLGELFGNVWGNYAPPLFAVLIAVLIWSACACVVVNILKIENGALAAVTASVFVSFPTVAGTMLYVFTAGYYALALALAVGGVWAVRRGGIGYAFGIAMFACSLGIYQAYLPLMATLLLLALMRDSLEGKIGTAALFLRCVLHLLSLAAGLALYYVILKLSLLAYGAQLDSYQGVSTMGISLADIPRLLARAYEDFGALPVKPVYDVNGAAFVRVMIAVLYAISAASFVLCHIRTKLTLPGRVLSVVLALLFPLAAGSIELISGGSYIHVLMVYALAAVFMLPAMLTDIAIANREHPRASGRAAVRVSKIALTLTAAAISLSSLNYIWQANGNYMLLYYANTQLTEYYSSMVTRIKAADGYDDGKKLVIIGENITDASYNNDLYDSLPFRTSAAEGNMLNIYSRLWWMRAYLGFDPQFATEEEKAAVMATAEAADMTCYPADGSILVIGDCVVIKLEEIDYAGK